MFSDMAMLSLGYRSGVRANEIGIVMRMHNEGKTPKEISTHLRVDIKAIESLCQNLPQGQELAKPEPEYTEEPGFQDITPPKSKRKR